MTSALSNTSNAAQNPPFLELPSELQAKIICHTDESDWENLYLTCNRIKTVMDKSRPLLIEVRAEQRALSLFSQIDETFQNSPLTATLGCAGYDAYATLVILFERCRTPDVKMKAFAKILGATHLDGMARRFYWTLPEGKIGKLEASRTSYRHQIWLTNGQPDDGSGIGFGEHVVENDPRGSLAIHAALDLSSKLLLTKKIEETSNAIDKWIPPKAN